MTKPPLTLYMAAPRGFCAGVDRAIKIVEMALEKWARRSMSAMKSYITNSSSMGCATKARCLSKN